MGGFFNLDGPFYKFGSLIADIMILSLLWIVFSLPIITIGASTTAVFYVTTRRISDKDQYLFRDFLTSFKRNFVTATLAFLTLAGIMLLVIVNIMNIGVVGNMQPIILPFQYCVLVEAIFMSLYVCPLLSRFDMKYVQLFKTAFFMANRHLLTTIMCLILFIGALLASYLTVVFSLVAVGTYCYITSFLFVKRFKKYRPEMDADIDYEELHQKLRKKGEGDSDAIFNDAAGLLIEKQAKENEPKKKGLFSQRNK